jgi:Bacterial transcriptional activator domain/Transposase
VSNPKTRAIAGAKVKADKVDARILAQLLPADFLPPVWLPDERTRSLRRQVTRRAHLVRQRTRIKNQVHAILARNLAPTPPVSDLFGTAGRQWLARQDLPADERSSVQALLRGATGVTAPMWSLHAAGRYSLDPARIRTDLQQFTRALDQARHAANDQDKLAASRTAAGLYHGDLAEGAAWEWTEPYAETARRRVLDAWTTIADILAARDPGQALAALEAALGHDPYNEHLYQKIMRLQAATGHPEAARRTLSLLEARLTQLGITPGTQTRHVAATLLGTPSPPSPPPPSRRHRQRRPGGTGPGG